MKRVWLIPVTVIEFGRVVRIEAESKTEAIKKLRSGEWESADDPSHYKVTKVGAARLADGD
jgi:hypothetical protein